MPETQAGLTISLSQDMLQQIIATAVTVATSALSQQRPVTNSLIENPRRSTISAGTSQYKWLYINTR